MKEFIVITKDCLAISKNEDGEIISKLLLRKGDKLKVGGAYSYYEKASSPYWNTIHPVINIGRTFVFCVPPECYNYSDYEKVYGIKDYTDRIVLKNFSIDYYVRTIINDYIRLRNSMLYDNKS